MTALALLDSQGIWLDTHVCEAPIRLELRRHGLDFGRWESKPLKNMTVDVMRDAYAEDLQGLQSDFVIRDVERLNPYQQAAQWKTIRQRLSTERVQSSPEIYHFLDGISLLYVRHAQGYLGLLCEARDWVWLDAGTPYRLVLGDSPGVDALRLLAHPQDGNGRPTGVSAPPLPSLDDYVEHLLGLEGQAID